MAKKKKITSDIIDENFVSVETDDCIQEEVNADVEHTECSKTDAEEIKEQIKVCKVLAYNKNKTLDILFDKYGIRIKNINKEINDTVEIYYTGMIGTPDFKCRLK